MIKMKISLFILIFAMLLSSLLQVKALLASAGICYSGCNVLWVTCVSVAGGVAGVSTGGIGVPATILSCNSA